jgi:hypothetical protein
MNLKTLETNAHPLCRKAKSFFQLILRLAVYSIS